MKLHIEKHNSTEYLYLCSSNRIDGKQHPVTTKRYVGIVDSKTGLVTPKKVPPEAFLAQIYDREFSSADIGRIILAKHAAESIGMLDYLESMFPDKANVIYATVLSLVADPYVKSDIVRHMSKFYLDDVLGTNTIRSKPIADTLHNLHKDLMRTIQRTTTQDQKCVFVLKADSHQRIDKVVPSNVVFLVTGTDGTPLFARSLESASGPAESYRIAMKYAREAGGSSVLILDSPEGPDVLSSLAVSGISFISEADNILDEDEVISYCALLSENEFSHKIWNGKECMVHEIPLVFKRSEGKWKVAVSENNSCEAVKLRAYLWYDPADYDSQLSLFKKMSHYKTEELKTMSLDEASIYLNDGGVESHFMSVARDNSGGTKVITHTKTRRLMAMRFSTHLFVTNSSSWSDCMIYMDLQRRLIRNSDPIMNAVMGRDGSRIGRVYLACLSVMVRLTIEKMIADSRLEGFTVDEVMDAASHYTVVRVNDFVYHSRIDRNTRRVFVELGIDPDAYLCNNKASNNQTKG